MALGFALWSGAERPELLISGTGGLVGHMGEDGRSLSRPRGDGFVAGIWLENDGDAATQAEAATRSGWREADAGQVTRIGDYTLWHGAGRAASRAVEPACDRYDIVVMNLAPEDPSPLVSQAIETTRAQLLPLPEQPYSARASASCWLLTPRVLARSGAIAVSVEDGALRFDTAQSRQGARLWSR